MENIINRVKFDDKGLVGAIIQDNKTGQVVMFAWMNKESLEITIKEGKCCYWSRSRGKLWLKGESSGHFQTVKAIYTDCDNDCLLIKVEQEGGACHTGHYSCFYTALENGQWIEKEDKIFDEKKVYNK